jgi:acetaldehyde dehydrogenase
MRDTRNGDRVGAAIIGSGNIGTDLMMKILRLSKVLRVAAMIGVDPASDGLARAARLGVPTSAQGIDGLVGLPDFANANVQIVFDATSAAAHARHESVLRKHGKQVIDLTPAAIGPYVVPPVNGDEHLDSPNVNMVTCGGQATIPIVAAISRVSKVHYAEIVASIASKSAGPGTRANIDEFTDTTARAIERVGGARRGKAIIVLNPAEPPLIMRDTVYCLCEPVREEAIHASIDAMVSAVQSYVPGYRLKQRVQCELVGEQSRLLIPEMNESFAAMKVSVYLEIEGAAHYLPAYAGNLDIMTSAALRTAERIVSHRQAYAA